MYTLLKGECERAAAILRASFGNLPRLSRRIQQSNFEESQWLAQVHIGITPQIPSKMLYKSGFRKLKIQITIANMHRHEFCDTGDASACAAYAMIDA